MKTYKGQITKVEANQIFVFGSNTQGRHGKGAALFALKHCGAIYGQAKYLQGQSWAIITKDISVRPHKGYFIDEIILQIKDLYGFARRMPHLEFLIPYQAESVNLNGYSPQQMAQMFFEAGVIPDNIVFEEGFSKLISYVDN